MIRASLRLLGMALLSLVTPLVVALAVIVTLGNKRAYLWIGPFLMMQFSRISCRILGIRIERTGDLPPPGPCFVAPNHWGYIDVFVLGSQFRSHFVSRADVADWPVMGFFARAAGTLFIRREVKRDAARVGDALEHHLRAKCRVAAFLEGGTGRGTEVRPYKSSLLEAAVATGCPCVAAGLVYSLPRDPGVDPTTAVGWIDGSFTEHVWKLLRLRRIHVKLVFAAPRTGTDRKVLARLLEDDARRAVASALA